MPSLAVEGMENAGRPTAAFSTPPIATTAASIGNHPQILRGKRKPLIGIRGSTTVMGGMGQDNNGNTRISLYITGKNGLSAFNDLGTIGIYANLSIASNGNVSVDSSSRTKGFPSIEGFAYRMVNGKVVVQVLFKKKEEDPKDLKGDRRSATQMNKALRIVSVLVLGIACYPESNWGDLRNNSRDCLHVAFVAHISDAQLENTLRLATAVPHEVRGESFRPGITAVVRHDVAGRPGYDICFGPSAKREDKDEVVRILRESKIITEIIDDEKRSEST